MARPTAMVYVRLALDPAVHEALERKRMIAGYTTVNHYLVELAMRDVTGSPESAAVGAARSAALTEARQAIFGRVRRFFEDTARTFTNA